MPGFCPSTLVQQRYCIEIIYRKYILYTQKHQNPIHRLSLSRFLLSQKKNSQQENSTKTKTPWDPPTVGYNQQIQHCTAYTNGCFGQKVPRCYDVHLLPARREKKTKKNLLATQTQQNVSKKAICLLEKSVVKIYDIFVQNMQHLKYFMCLHQRQTAFKNSQTE